VSEETVSVEAKDIPLPLRGDSPSDPALKRLARFKLKGSPSCLEPPKQPDLFPHVYTDNLDGSERFTESRVLLPLLALQGAKSIIGDTWGMRV
jgi:hypothetical protein